MSVADFQALREGRADCPSDFTLDRLHARELDAAAARTAEQHIAGCEVCGARMAKRRAGLGAIEGSDPRVMLARIRSRLDEPASLGERVSRWLRRGLAPLVLAGAAAAVAIVALRPADTGPADVLRPKGALALHVYRLVDGHAQEAVSAEAFAPGDRLRFKVNLPSEGHVAIFGVERSGKLYTAWPLEEGTDTHLNAGDDLELPGAVKLDETPGEEILYLVHCPLAVGTPRCTSAGPEKPPACPAECAHTAFRLGKKP